MFASNITLEECREAIRGRREFRETRKGSLVVINYDFCFGATFADPNGPNLTEAERRLLLIRRECRGIIFDANTGGLLCRRLHKFMNLDQSEESAASKLRLDAEPHVCVEKLDGAMMSGLVMMEECVLVSKNGPTELSRQVESVLATQPTCNWKGLCQRWAARGYTVTFEWVSPSHCIILHYDEPRLFCTAIRHIQRGDYLTHAQMAREAEEFGVAVPKLLWESATQGVLRIDELVARIKSRENLEGCVLKMEASHLWFKIKSDWYFAQSRSHLLLPTSERLLWAAILGCTMDDLLPALTPEVRARVDKFSESVFSALQGFAQVWAERMAKLNCKEYSQQGWAQFVREQTKQGSFEETLMYKSYSLQENELLPTIISIASKQCHVKRFAAMREELKVEHLNFYGGTEEDKPESVIIKN